jgi:hypothetical protein
MSSEANDMLAHGKVCKHNWLDGMCQLCGKIYGNALPPDAPDGLQLVAPVPAREPEPSEREDGWEIVAQSALEGGGLWQRAERVVLDAEGSLLTRPEPSERESLLERRLEQCARWFEEYADAPEDAMDPKRSVERAAYARGGFVSTMAWTRALPVQPSPDSGAEREMMFSTPPKTCTVYRSEDGTISSVECGHCGAVNVVGFRTHFRTPSPESET